MALLDSNRLRRGAIGPVGLAALAVGILSPAIGLFALWPPIEALAGPIAPVVYLCAMLITLPTALSYASLNAQAPSAGAGLTWLWRSWSPAAGYLLGLIMVTYLVMGTIIQPLLFGLFAMDLAGFFGLQLHGLIPWTIAIAAATVPVIWSTRRGMEKSVRTTVTLMIVESLVVVALSLTILLVKAAVPGALNAGPIHPANGTGGLAGFWSAMVIGVLGFAGFDVVSTAAEEARSPRTQIPLAMLLTVLGTGMFWILNSWVYTLSTSTAAVVSYTNQGATAVTPIAREFWGRGSILIIFTAFSGLTAVYISSIIATSRLIFALARHGLLPRPFARLAPDYQVPANAMHAVFAFTIGACVVSIAILHDGVSAFLWWSNAQVFFLTLTFGGVNVANILFFIRIAPARFHWARNGLIPVTGLAVNGYVCYEAFFKSLWVENASSGRSVVAVCLGILAAFVILVTATRAFAPARLRGAPPLSADHGSEP